MSRVILLEMSGGATTTPLGLDRLWPESFGEHTDVRDRLVATYADPARGYHDLQHLREVLDHVAQLAGPGIDRQAVVLAAWFHDAVYTVSTSSTTPDGWFGEASDEERSAQLAEHELGRTGVPKETVAEVARLVRLTESHDPAGDDRNGQVLCDADLAILAADPARYADYVAGVRREHTALSDDQFAAGRAAVLRGLLARPAIFRTPTARARWEEGARANIRAELSRLTGRPGRGSH